MRQSFFCLAMIVMCCVQCLYRAEGQSMNPLRYDIGNPTVRDIWVDPVNGNDDNPGSSTRPYKTVYAAWESIPANEELTGNGWRINLKPGVYTSDDMPLYWDERYGSARYPIIIRPAESKNSVKITAGINMALCSYVYFIDLILEDTMFATADIVHLQFSDHILLRNCTLIANRDITQECLKVNQCQYVYVEDNDISGAWDNAVDFVAVQYGHIVANKIHNCGDWGLYLKGGSAYFRVENNEIYNTGTGGFTAGQGTGFQFMTPPFLHYETYDCKFINNSVHDVEGAGFGVNGGYNILIAHNTCYRVGERSHVVEVTFGGRSCDGQPGGDFDSCDVYRTIGGWGNSLVSDGINYVRIPNKNVYIFNNIVYNPTGYQSLWQHFFIPAPYSGEWNINVNAPNPANADENLRIRGNIIWNGSANHALGVGEGESGCSSNNPTCNTAQLLADNAINSREPQLQNPSVGNFAPIKNSSVYQVTTFPIPDFAGNDRPSMPPSPAGNYANSVTRDAQGNARTGNAVAGAYIGEGGISSVFTSEDIMTPYSVEYKDDIAFLHISAPSTKNLTIRLFTLTGTEIMHNFPSEISYGDTWIPLPTNLSSGVYYLIIQSGDESAGLPVMIAE